MTTDNSYKQVLTHYADLLLAENTNWQTKKETLCAIGELFSELDAYKVENVEPNFSTNERKLNTGYAVSTWSAAMCLQEISRTVIFFKGIMQAIKNLLSNTTKRPVHILDAGCGPYALLSILPALYFTKEEVCFHLIDIIPDNISSAKKIISGLGLEEHFKNIYQEDATTFTWQETAPLQMVISETMLNALKKEPQVAITLNLGKQLATNGIFIPEKINITLVQTDPGKRQSMLMDPAINCMDQEIRKQFEFTIDHILCLDKHSSYSSLNKIDLPTVILPETYDPQFHHLELHTSIQVFEKHVLQFSDCSLTLPLAISKPNKNTIPKRSTLGFHYEVSDYPGIVTNVLS